VYPDYSRETLMLIVRTAVNVETMIIILPISSVINDLKMEKESIIMKIVINGM
jgi:hypothetical protein